MCTRKIHFGKRLRQIYQRQKTKQDCDKSNPKHVSFVVIDDKLNGQSSISKRCIHIALTNDKKAHKRERFPFHSNQSRISAFDRQLVDEGVKVKLNENWSDRKVKHKTDRSLFEQKQKHSLSVGQLFNCFCISFVRWIFTIQRVHCLWFVCGASMRRCNECNRKTFPSCLMQIGQSQTSSPSVNFCHLITVDESIFLMLTRVNNHRLDDYSCLREFSHTLLRSSVTFSIRLCVKRVTPNNTRWARSFVSTFFRDSLSSLLIDAHNKAAPSVADRWRNILHLRTNEILQWTHKHIYCFH